jgi:PKD repeat protein
VSYVDRMFVTFDASTCVNPYGTIINYSWNFGDTQSQNSTTPIITYTYTSVNSYNVKLDITDDKGATATITIPTTTTNNILPVANFNTPTINGYTVAIVSTSTDSDGTIVSTRWNWGDGAHNDTTDSATHTYAQAGTYTITLSVVDNSNAASPSQTVEVTVPSAPPIVNFSATVNQFTVDFDASASSSFATIASYLWTFGDSTTQTTTDPTVSKTYTEVGSYTVKLEVTDSKGAKASLEKTVITVSNEVPIASFDVSSLNGYTASVLSTSTDSDGAIASFKWSWGDDTSNDTTSST